MQIRIAALLYFFQTADILTKTFIKSNTIQHNRIKQVYEQISIQIYITYLNSKNHTFKILS